MNQRSLEVLVIGAGPGGYVAGIRLGQLGKQVLVVDKGQIGGVCLTRGCIPTKALLHAASTARAAHAAELMGLSMTRPEVDLSELNSWKDGIVARLRKGIEFLFKANGVDYRRAEAKLLDPETVVLSGEYGEETVRPNATIIATGSEPVVLSGFEPDGESIITSDEAVQLNSVPERLLIIGAGSVGLEFATLYSALGSRVIVVEILGQLLPGTDSEIAGALFRTMSRQGIEFHLNTKATEVKREGTLAVTLSEEGEESLLEVDQILVSIGREAYTSGLGLELTGVSLNKEGFIKVDEQRRTSVRGIYAIGDITGPPLLAHKAMTEGVVAAEVIGGLSSAFKPKAMANCVFTQPEVATVGLSEEEAKSRGYDVSVGRFPLVASGKALVLGETGGLAKVISDKETDLLLGVHLLAPGASSMIGEAVLALEIGISADQLACTIHPHPTLSEVLHESAANLHKKAIHIPNQ